MHIKRLIVSLAILLLTVVSCQLDSLPKGMYMADTKDGVLYLQLMSNHECSLQFAGGKSKDGSYWISGDEIDLIANVHVDVGGRDVSWWFGGSLGKGTIVGDTFTIQSQRLYSSDKVEYINLTFRKI